MSSNTWLFSKDEASAIPPPNNTKIPQGILTVSFHCSNLSDLLLDGIRNKTMPPKIATLESLTETPV